MLTTQRLVRRAAGLGLLAATCAAAPAQAGIVDTTITTTCEVTALPSQPPLDGRQVDVRVRGQFPSSVKPGEPFSMTGTSLRFTIDPQVVRPQVAITRGELTARLESVTLSGTGTNEASASTPDLPLDLGTIPNRVDLAPKWLAPPKGTLSNTGPFTATPATRSATFGLSFTLLVTHTDPSQPTFAPVAARLACTSAKPFAAVPVRTAATGIPTVSKVLPNRAAPGTWVNVYGRNLGSASSVSFSLFGGAAYEIVSANQLRVLVPTVMFVVSPGPYLPTRVIVKNELGTSADTRWDDMAWLYDKTYTGPAVTSITPSAVSSQRTSLVWFEGTGLKGATSVTIGGEEAPFLAISDTRMAVQTTPRAAGSYGVGVTANAGTMPDEQIRVQYQDPPLS